MFNDYWKNTFITELYKDYLDEYDKNTDLNCIQEE